MSPEYLILTDHDFVRLMALQPDPRLRAELERAIVVPPETIPAQVVTMHSRVRYLDESSGERRELQVVYPEEAALIDGQVSVFAPVGAALLGLSVDHAIELDFPGGGKRRLRVEEVVDQPESRLRRTG